MYLIERVNLYVKKIGERLVAKCNMCVGVVFVTILVARAVVTNTQASTIDVVIAHPGASRFSPERAALMARKGVMPFRLPVPTTERRAA
jgi:hypothetical protein